MISKDRTSKPANGTITENKNCWLYHSYNFVQQQPTTVAFYELWDATKPFCVQPSINCITSILQNTNITSTKTVIEGNHILPYHTTPYTASNERQIYRHWCSVNYSKYRILHLATKNNRNDYTFLHNRTEPNQETKIIIIYRQLLKQKQKQS